MANITRMDAVELCDAAIAKAQGMGIKVTVSVVDAGGHLVTMQRMEGALLLSIEISKGKALTSVLFGVPSVDTVARNENPAMQAAQLQMGGKFVMAQGALPIKRNGELLGAIGVSGAKSDEDEDCARAALTKLGFA
ncbi:MAG: heme-binding protein [Chloroflexi bacterium]|nr:heme-binding protein [Chloroflexota bacterium]